MSVSTAGLSNVFSHPLYGHLSLSSLERPRKSGIWVSPPCSLFKVSGILIFYKDFRSLVLRKYNSPEWSLGRALTPRPAAYEAAALPG